MTTTPGPAIPRVLAIAASDSSGAAGVQADLKTFEARGVFGLCALTAVTAQDSRTIYGVKLMEPPFIAAQIEAVLNDIGADVIKTGLLLKAEIIQMVADTIRPYTAHQVIDPVLVAGDGRRLVDDSAIEVYRSALFPLATVITPNLDEAAILTGHAVRSLDSMREAARALQAMGPRAALVKGGHLAEGEMIDMLYDGRNFYEFRSPRLPVNNPRGAGCTFASCIAAELAKGQSLESAVATAQAYVAVALSSAQDWHLGEGRGALHHAVGRPPSDFLTRS